MSSQPPEPPRRLLATASSVPLMLVIAAGLVWVICAGLWVVEKREEPELMGLCLTTICGLLVQQGVSALRGSQSSPAEPPPPLPPEIPAPDPGTAA